MKERKRRQSLGGAVLIMVMTVMFILMILLMATLTTVSTANQRIFTKYEENQAYYTARSALDVFTQNMIADKNYLTTIDYDYTKADGTPDKVKMKQGLELQLDLYAMKAHKGGNNITQTALKNYVTGLPTGDEKKKTEYNKYFGTDSTVEVTQRMNNGKAPTDTDYDEWDLMTYKVMLPKTSNKGTYGKLADSEEATITIEILDRDYDIGGYSIPSGFADKDEFFEKATDGQKAEAFISGNRKKDTMRIKITAKTQFVGVDGTAVLIIDSNEPPANNSSNAVTTFGGGSADNMNILGGASMVGNVNWGNDGVVYGDIFAEGDFDIGGTGPIARVLSEGESFFVGGDFKPSSANFQVKGDSSITDKSKRPFLFVGGKIISGNMSTNNFQNVDIIANGVEITGNDLDLNGCDIYCKGTFNMSGANDVKSSATGSNIYVDGDIILRENYDGKQMFTVNKVDATDPSTWTVYINDPNVTVHQINGTIKDSSGNDLKALGAVIMNAPQTMTALKLPSKADVLSKTIAGRTDTALTKSTISVTLPGGTKKEIKTHVDNYDTYYQKDASEELILVGGNPVPKTPQDMADISTMSDKTKPFTSADTGITADINTKLTNNNENVFGENFQRTLNTSGGTVQCALTPSSFKNGIHIKGGGTVELLVSGSYSDTKILVDDDTTLKIIGDTSTSQIFFDKLKLYNETVLEGVKTGTPINVGNKRGCGIKVPKIYIYTTGNKEFKVQNDAFITAYYYGPDSTLEFGNGGLELKFNYNGIATTDRNENPGSKLKIAVIGSVLSNEIKLPNSTGVAYINPDLDEDTPGEPIHQWKSFQYVRS